MQVITEKLDNVKEPEILFSRYDHLRNCVHPSNYFLVTDKTGEIFSEV